MGSYNIEQSLSIAPYGIRAKICPSSRRDYHPVHMANDDLSLQTSLTGRSTVFYYKTINYGRQERMLYNDLVGISKLCFSSDIHHMESAYHLRYSRSSE